MKELVESIEKQIATDKEVISVLPRNGIKAIKTLDSTIKEMIDSYEKLNEALLKEIESRYDKLTVVEENDEIPKIEQEILKYNNSVDEKLESLQKEVDYLRGIESCMKYTSNMVIFDSEFIQNQTLTTSSLDTDFRRVGYFNFDAEDVNDRRFNWL